jgi:hypothetical protein
MSASLLSEPEQLMPLASEKENTPNMELWTSPHFKLLFNLHGNLHRSTYVMQSACSPFTFKPKIILLL